MLYSVRTEHDRHVYKHASCVLIFSSLVLFQCRTDPILADNYIGNALNSFTTIMNLEILYQDLNISINIRNIS